MPDDTNGSAAGRIRILLVDDQPMLGLGFRMVLQAQPDMQIVGEAGDGNEAVDQAARQRPDVVLMDVRMPRMNGIAATAVIASTVPTAKEDLRRPHPGQARGARPGAGGCPRIRVGCGST